MDKTKILDYIIFENLKNFKELKSKKNIDYNIEFARDRKSMIILKSIMAEVHIENMKLRKNLLK